MGALTAQEMHVRVAAEPAALVHVCPSFEAQFEFALTAMDVHALAERFVFESAGGIDDDFAAG